MAVTSTQAPRRPSAALASPRRWRPDSVLLGAIVLVALALALLSHAHHLQGLPGIIRGSVASLVLFVVCGDAIAYRLVPSAWGVLVALFTLPLGAAASGLVLTAFGFMHVPLSVSLWLTLALGLLASWLVRRGRTVVAQTGAGRAERVLARLYPGVRIVPRELAMWLAVLFVLLCVALLPVFRNGADTIFGENPDAHQVAGIAVLLQHVPPTGTDYKLPVNTVPPAWHFRYSIFYPLSAASNLSHFDPIRVFPSMAALLMIACALGFAVLAIKCLGAPQRAAPAIATAFGISWLLLHLGWHPYWNQLWGLMLFPYALLFGWRALAEREGGSAILCFVLLVGLELAYPLALPYPLLILIVLWVLAYPRRPRLPGAVRRHAFVSAIVGFLVLGSAAGAAAAKLYTALGQILSPHSALWGGDVTTLTPVGRFLGTGGGLLPALAVLAVAAAGVRALPRRVAIGLGGVLLLTFLLDVRLRTAKTGAYMDFKHLSFVGALVLALAASAVARMCVSSRRVYALAGLAMLAVWTAAALHLSGTEGRTTGEQVTPELFQIRSWAGRVPPHASVRVDIPASGWQLWAIYMLGDHPVNSPDPVTSTTYAHAPYGIRAKYAIAFRYRSGAKVPQPPVLFARNPPLFENDAFVLRAVAWPARYDYVHSTASRRAVQP